MRFKQFGKRKKTGFGRLSAPRGYQTQNANPAEAPPSKKKVGSISGVAKLIRKAGKKKSSKNFNLFDDDCRVDGEETQSPMLPPRAVAEQHAQQPPLPPQQHKAPSPPPQSPTPSPLASPPSPPSALPDLGARFAR